MKEIVAFFWLIIAICGAIAFIASIFIADMPRYMIGIFFGVAVLSFITFGAILED